MTSQMSAGISPYDFVQQVYYMQEKTLLDFWASDDKYREVLVEANLVLRELEAVEDWTWLRERIVLGPCTDGDKQILEFKIPTEVYKLSTLYKDCLKLYPAAAVNETITEVDGEEVIEYNYTLDEVHFIPVPITSAGNQRFPRQLQTNFLAVNHIHDRELKAVVHGDTIRFTRPLLKHECNMFLTADVQMHIKPFHVCSDVCGIANPDTNFKYCNNADSVYLTEIPDPNYVIMATAARHAEGSPPALARVAGLQDAAQRILSQMRQNDAAATESDWLDWDVPGYVEVI